MKICFSFLAAVLLATSVHAQPAASQGGFREVLEIVGVDPTKLSALDADQPTTADGQIIAQIIARLEQQEADLGRWTRPIRHFSPVDVGELFDMKGTVEQVDKLDFTEGLTPTELYRCRLKLEDGEEAILLTARIPSRWELGKPLAESVSLRGVLLHEVGTPVLLTTHVSWFPAEGLPAGQLLLARFGMDAALWDEVIQRTSFVSPERGREAQAFYACLAAIAKVPPAELAALTLEAIAQDSAERPAPRTKREQAIAALVAEYAGRSLSSVAPLFLESQDRPGQLVRIEGIARRAVRIVADEQAADQPIREFYELEVFTADSQNLPIICCVARLPAEFPVGDAIRAGVRFDGVFFKLWRYHSRKSGGTAGETITPQYSYTPVVMAPTVTWLKQATTPERWWGLIVGGIVFVLVMGGLTRMVFFSRPRSQTFQDDTPDFSSLRGK